MLNKIIRYFLENKLVTVLILIGFIAWGIVTNKPERFTTPLLEQLGLTERCAAWKPARDVA